MISFEELKEIIARLRAKDGCPWDREQTHESLKRCMIEEAYESVEAITVATETGNYENLCEELGDMLLQIMLHSQIAGEEGHFTLEEVIDRLGQKMIYRHPHVFGKRNAMNTDNVLATWEELKGKEKGHSTEIPKAFPALLRMEKVLKKMDRQYRSSTKEESMQLLSEELTELEEINENEKEQTGYLVGKMLRELVNIARLSGVQAEEALAKECERFLSLKTD
ncbi:MAG: MazG family protein [Lachnospiraceae bacterium]